MNRDLRVVFFGTPHFVIPVLKTLQNNFKVVGVVTAPDSKVGRDQLLTPSPVKSSIKENEVQVLNPEKLSNATVSSLRKLEPDLFVVAAYGQIIPQEVLDIPKYGALNIHPSLLPKYRGASPIQAAILNGDEITGISIIKMDAKMDHGPLVFQEEFTLTPTDTFETVSNNIFQQAARRLPEIIEKYINNQLYPTEQDHNRASFCSMIKKESGYFDINNPPPKDQLNRMIHAYYPWPTVWTKWKDKVVKFLPGNFIQMEGKKPVGMADFLHGHLNFPVKI